MNSVLKILTAGVMLALPLTADAADTAAPPQGTAVYPCWDMMQNGQMTPMRGMWHMAGQGGAQGAMMMMRSQDVLQMQKEIEELRKQVMELKNKPPKQ